MADTPDEAHADIEWSSAQVESGDLTVALAGEPSTAWLRRAKAVAERLQPPPGACEQVEITKQRITVSGVAEGREGDVHHFLSGVVQQANADLAAEQDDAADDGRSERDRGMTDAFRAFGEHDEEPAQ